MQETQNTSHDQVQKGRYKTVAYISSITLVLAILVGVVAYYLQGSRAEAERQQLQTHIHELKALKHSDTKSSRTHTYGSKVGGLKLELSDQYPVIVQVDGNKGGAPGTTLRIGTRIADGVVEDNIYSWTEIDVSPSTGSLDDAVATIKSRLMQQMFSNIKVTDVKVANLPAKLLTAEGKSYDAMRRIYVINNDEFTYQLTSKTQDASKDSDVLKAVVSGITIEEKTSTN